MNFNFEQTLGIIGGGQLSKMLLASAHQWGLRTHIFTGSTDDPAASLSQKVTIGSIEDSKALENWIVECDIVTIESEFVDLSKIESSKINPPPQILHAFRDRLSQKSTLVNLKLPTSPFLELKDIKEFKNPMVFKQRLFGYDGYGTVVIKTKKDFKKFMDSKPNLIEWIGEDFIPFKKELAFSIARNKNNDFCILPLVETKQKDSKCFWVKGPVKNKNLDPLIKKAKSMMKKIDYTGLLTFELFELKDKTLMINEVAPRVHNSGHYGIEALPLSQFDIHNMAVLNLKLPKTVEPYSPFAMVNLIGSSDIKPKLKPSPSTSLHWYAKKENRKGRKMGHITALAKKADDALEKALKDAKKQTL